MKTLAAKLQHMLFGKSAEKLHDKTQYQVHEVQERISAQQEEMAKVPLAVKLYRPP